MNPFPFHLYLPMNEEEEQKHESARDILKKL